MPQGTLRDLAQATQAERLAMLRAIVEAGGPQRPVVSGPRPPSIGGRTIGQVNDERVLPLNDTEPLAQHGLFNALFGHGATRSVTPSMEDVGGMSPMMGVVRIPVAQTLEEIGKRMVGPSGRALRGVMAEAVGGRTMPAPRGRLDRTLEVVNGDVRLRPDVVDRLGVFHEVGGKLPDVANWDGADHADLLKAFADDRGAAEVYGQQWGATSPNTDVLRNTLESEISQLYQLTHGGEPIPLAVAQSLDPIRGKQLITSAESKVPNIGRAIRGEPLSGPKVREMGHYAAGRPATPVDVHAMYGLGSKYDKLDDYDLPAVKAWLGRKLGLPESHHGSLTDQQTYDIYASTIGDALRQIDSTASHNRNFGQMWEGVKAWKGQPSVGGFIDVLRKQDLLRPGAMLDPTQLRNALKRAGITTPFAVALMQAMQDEPDQDR